MGVGVKGIGVGKGVGVGSCPPSISPEVVTVVVAGGFCSPSASSKGEAGVKVAVAVGFCSSLVSSNGGTGVRVTVAVGFCSSSASSNGGAGVRVAVGMGVAVEVGVTVAWLTVMVNSKVAWPPSLLRATKV